MAATVTLTVTVAGLTKTGTMTLAESETFAAKSLIATGNDQEKELGLVTVPKYVAAFGDDGVSVSLASAGSDIQANPFCVVAKETNGWAQASLFISSVNTQPVPVTVFADE
jgi:hypothetical protein